MKIACHAWQLPLRPLLLKKAAACSCVSLVDPVQVAGSCNRALQGQPTVAAHLGQGTEIFSLRHAQMHRANANLACHMGRGCIAHQNGSLRKHKPTNLYRPVLANGWHGHWLALALKDRLLPHLAWIPQSAMRHQGAYS